MTQQSPHSAVDSGLSGKLFPKTLLAIFALIPCVGSFVFAVSSQSLPTLAVTKPRPSLLFATYLYHHGDRAVELKPKLESEFRFRNLGDAPVEITRIEQSCGCLQPRILRPEDVLVNTNVIEPGGYGAIDAPIATANQQAGPQEYTINVHYNDPLPRQTTLTIKAVFPEKKVMITPRTFLLSQKTQSSFPLPQLTVSDFRDTPLTIKNVYSTAPFIKANVADEAVSGIQQVSMEEQVGKSTKIVGEVAGGIPPGRHHALIAASTNDPEYPAFTVPMVINGPAYPPGVSVKVSPEQFRVVASNHPAAERQASIAVTMPAAWKIDYAESWPDQLSVTYSDGAMADNQQQVVVVKVELTELPPKNVKDGIIQLIANGGQNLVTVKANLIWP